MSYLSRCPWGHWACPVACTSSHGRGDMPRWGGCQVAPWMRTSKGEREVVPERWEAQAEGEVFVGSAEGPGHPGIPAPPGVDPRRRSAAPPTRPCLTSRRCSSDSNALGWLPGPGRAGRRVIKGPGEMGGASAEGRSQSGGGRQPARRLLERPIRRRGNGRCDGGHGRAAGPTPRRQGAAEGHAAGGGGASGAGLPGGPRAARRSAGAGTRRAARSALGPRPGRGGAGPSSNGQSGRAATAARPFAPGPAREPSAPAASVEPSQRPARPRAKLAPAQPRTAARTALSAPVLASVRQAVGLRRGRSKGPSAQRAPRAQFPASLFPVFGGTDGAGVKALWVTGNWLSRYAWVETSVDR